MRSIIIDIRLVLVAIMFAMFTQTLISGIVIFMVVSTCCCFGASIVLKLDSA
ncbi:hypothetical protein [Xenorhabdus lircayensis]|uniref:Uncharacterized protein n=1 Tax=Xenorhabdus lircayensis TaxID=2763499 RepID=A0ABS0U1L1_9GAMM|nr:hypothetical protein [Xenorhabdus lircayensis]MBI6547768.1 hypothetical protein [Xenorhabdus lircayensis]